MNIKTECQRVSANQVVSLRFTLKNHKGEIIDDNMGNTPINYLHGSGNILPALQTGIEGMQVGEAKTFSFSNNDASDEAGSYSIDVVIDDIREATPFELQQGKPGKEPPGNACGPGCCC